MTPFISNHSNNKTIVKSKITMAAIFILLTLVISIALTSCAKPVDNNREAVYAVLQQTFNCPNEELITISNEMMEIHPNQSDITNGTDAALSEAFDEKLEEMYSAYFTEKAFGSFRVRNGSMYHLFSSEAGYKMKVDNIEIKKKDNKQSDHDFKVGNKGIVFDYEFTVELLYGPTNGEQTNAVVTGSTQCMDGKITFFRLFDDDGLMRLLSEKVNHPLS